MGYVVVVEVVERKKRWVVFQKTVEEKSRRRDVAWDKVGWDGRLFWRWISSSGQTLLSSLPLSSR